LGAELPDVVLTVHDHFFVYLKGRKLFIVEKTAKLWFGMFFG